jgi:uncharacterized protein
VKEAVVTDSTCLIGLERIGQLDLLPALFDPILAPSEVAREFGSTLPWLTVEAPANKSFIAALKLLVDDGEAEAIALATERQVRLITDDRQARNVARQLNLSIIGTIGILVKAKQAQLIPAIKPLIHDLESNGFFLSSALKAQALTITGE